MLVGDLYLRDPYLVHLNVPSIVYVANTVLRGSRFQGNVEFTQTDFTPRKVLKNPLNHHLNDSETLAVLLRRNMVNRWKSFCLSAVDIVFTAESYSLRSPVWTSLQ